MSSRSPGGHRYGCPGPVAHCPDIWSNAEYAQALGRERASLEKNVNGIATLQDGLGEASELLEPFFQAESAPSEEPITQRYGEA